MTARHLFLLLPIALPLALPLTLAACGGAPATPDSACAAAANDDPEVRDLQGNMAASPWLQTHAQDELKAARQRATLDCLRRQGLAPPGGVERVRPAGGLFNGLF